VTSVTHCKIQKKCVSESLNGMSPIIRTNGTIFYSPSSVILRALYSGLRYMYSEISVIVDLLPANTKV